MSALKNLTEKLLSLKNKNYKVNNYKIPEIWLEKDSNKIVEVDPYSFFVERIKRVNQLSQKAKDFKYKKWSDQANIYNMFVRLFSAFDHDGDGRIGFPIGTNCFRETGTFLKSIALVPYLHSLGINTIYLLPITSIGIDGRKGNLGSPYAIKDPYKLDENLSEPGLDLPIEEQFKAFVEAAHLLKMKIVCEFVFRTASVDSDLAIEHPEWFYWLDNKIEDRGNDSTNKEKYGPPIFTEKELVKIREKVETGNFNELPKPPKEYIDMFKETPGKVVSQNNQLVGYLEKNKKVRIPGAFADWPPNDSQPVWSDVTYLKLYDKEDYNYIAYNTVRMYDEELKNEKYKVDDLWENICNIIPYYQNEFGIDGVMVDMGHALPSELRSELISRARKTSKNFAFWEENFVLSESSVKDGYDASLGYLPFDQHVPWKFKDLIRMFENKYCPIPFFGTPESHNTPRAASRTNNTHFNKFAYTFNKFLPVLTFIHNGFELAEAHPVNTGLGFNSEDYERYPAHELPLFSESSLSWNNESYIIRHIKKVNSIYDKLIKDKQDIKENDIHLLDVAHEDIIAMIRRDKKSNKEILILGNANSHDEIFVDVDLLPFAKSFKDELTGRVYKAEDGVIKILLHAYETMVGIIEIE